MKDYVETREVMLENFGKTILTLINSFSREGQMFRKQASESRLVLFIPESIQLNSFNLLNLNSSLEKITPPEHNHYIWKGKYFLSGMKLEVVSILFNGVKELYLKKPAANCKDLNFLDRS